MPCHIFKKMVNILDFSKQRILFIILPVIRLY